MFKKQNTNPLAAILNKGHRTLKKKRNTHKYFHPTPTTKNSLRSKGQKQTQKILYKRTKRNIEQLYFDSKKIEMKKKQRREGGGGRARAKSEGQGMGQGQDTLK